MRLQPIGFTVDVLQELVILISDSPHANFGGGGGTFAFKHSLVPISPASGQPYQPSPTSHKAYWENTFITVTRAMSDYLLDLE